MARTRSPRSLPLRREFGYALLVAGRPEAAIVLSDATLAGRDGFDDTGDLEAPGIHAGVGID